MKISEYSLLKLFIEHRLRCAFALLFATAHAACAQPQSCLRYDPESVTLTGKLHRETFPGRPNFESILNGDEAETGFYLALNSPICTVGDSGANREGHVDVREIQLLLNQDQYSRLKPSLGQTIALHGQLFSAYTGHHHALILMRVTDK